MINAGWRSNRFLGLSALGSLLALILGCTPSHPQSTFDALGPVAKSQLDLFYLIFWVAVVVFIAVGGAFLYAAIRYRRRRGQGDPEQTHGNTKLEIVWTVIPAIVLIAIAIPTIITIFDNADAPILPKDGGLLIEATGHQWWFEFRYPDSDVVTANEMHIPVGEPVTVNLDSVDVIHSFWVPKLAGKVDMVPNNPNHLWLMADEPGVYYGQCAEFCGISHANMRFKVIAQPRAEFDAWLLAQAALPFEPVDPLAIEGKDVFLSIEAGCRGCHTVAGTSARGRLGPNLTHFGSRRQLASGILDNTQANLRRWLLDPNEVKPGNVMGEAAAIYVNPDKALTEPQISALVAYLRSLE